MFGQQFADCALTRKDGGLARQGARQYCGVSEATHVLEVTVGDRPDVDEGYANRGGSFSTATFDATDYNDGPCGDDELFRSEVNVKSSIKGREESFQHVFETFEVPCTSGHSVRQIVDDVRRLNRP